MTSFELRNDAVALLGLLRRAGTLRLVVRCRGLSFVRRTRIGRFCPVRVGDRPLLVDGVSGLSLDPSRVRAVCMVPARPRAAPAIEFDFRDYGFGISFQPFATSQSERVVEELRSSFVEATMATSELLERGAGAWLDEWEALEACKPCPARTVCRIHDDLAAVKVIADGLRAGVRFVPSFVDSDGTVRRIASVSGSEAIVMESEHLKDPSGWDKETSIDNRFAVSLA